MLSHMSASSESGVQIRAVRYRVLPGTRAKARRLNRLAGACRFVWNELLDQQEVLHYTARMFGGRAPSPTFFTVGKSFTELRRSNDAPWLAELPFAVVRYALKRQADAWQRFFKGEAGRPKFKGRGCGMGFTIPDNVRIRNGHIAVPKTGEYRLRRRGGSPHEEGIPKQAVFTPEALSLPQSGTPLTAKEQPASRRAVSTCSMEGGKWFCTVFHEVKAEVRVNDGSAVGVDRNVGQCALSTGEIMRMPDLSRLEARKRRYQRRMARQVKGSGRRRRTRSKLARTSGRIANARANWCHHASRKIADAAHTVAIEDLRTKAMTKSAKGTAESPGSNVKAKSGLNRAILSSGWGGLERNLDYKAGRLVRVNPAYTSQTCHECGHVGAGNRPAQSTFRCQACGREANADVNAALNIRRQGLAQLDGEGRGCGRVAAATRKARPMNRQTGGEVRQAA